MSFAKLTCRHNVQVCCAARAVVFVHVQTSGDLGEPASMVLELREGVEQRELA